MNSTSDKQTLEFVDANVLVYAFDRSAGSKQNQAQRLLERLWESESGCLSVQVLQEFFVTLTKKVPRPVPIDEPLIVCGNSPDGGSSRQRQTMLWLRSPFTRTQR